MLGILCVSIPILAFLLLWLIFLKKADWRSSLLIAAVIWGTLLTLITESLSLFSLVSFRWILGAWVSVCCLLGFLYFKRYRFEVIPPLISLKRSQPFILFSCAGIGVIAGTLGLLALVVPPNNWDSMTYHMSRVVNWMQDQNVAHYPATDPRQLYPSPWSEYAIMHLQILSGGDRFANLVQWTSMLGCTVGVSLIAKQLGASPVGQMLASIICITIPIGILESSTTQNDYVVAFWLVCFAYFSLQTLLDQFQLKQFVGLGCSLGLALLTKGTGYIYAFPFCLLLFLGLLFNRRNIRYLNLAIALGLSFLLNISFWWRNFSLFGSPLPSAGETNRLYTIPALLSNLSRNIAIHAASFYQPLNDKIQQGVIEFHKLLGLATNDPRTTFLGLPFQISADSQNQLISLHEDVSGNPIHLLLILTFLALYVFNRRAITPLRTYYLITLLGVLCFYNLTIAWQPWASRLHLPFFVLAAAWMGTILAESFTGYILPYVVTSLLLSFSVPYLLFNFSKPLAKSDQFITGPPKTVFEMSRVEQYFNNNSALKEPYFQAVDLVKSKRCSHIGLSLGNTLEYPLWVLFDQYKGDGFQTDPILRFRNEVVDPQIKKIFRAKQVDHPSRQFIPCIIISDVSNTLMSQPSIKIPIQQSNGVRQIRYTQIWSSPSLYIYERKRRKSL